MGHRTFTPVALTREQQIEKENAVVNGMEKIMQLFKEEPGDRVVRREYANTLFNLSKQLHNLTTNSAK